MSVKNRHPQYDRFARKWRRVRDVCAGQDEVHEAGKLYLPKLKDEEDEEYKARVCRTPFVNFSWRTIAALKGMLFRKPPMLKVPAGVEALLKDVSLKNVPFTVFAQNVALEVLGPGRVGILVDHPPRPEGKALTVAQAERLGLRPTLQLYTAESIINHKLTKLNNKVVLSQVRLEETRTIEKSEFEDETETVYRVLDLDEAGFYRQRVFRVKDGKDELIEGPLYPLMNGAKLTEIPFYGITPEGEGLEYAEPPLIDLVDLNLSHYQTNADYEHGCHFTALPTPWVAGFQRTYDDRTGEETTPKLYIGSTSAWLFSNPETKVGFLEYTGGGLSELRENRAAKEKQMAVIGARMLMDETKGVETLGAHQIKRTGENSILADIAIAVSDGLTRALEMFARWAGAAGEVEFELNRDFLPVPMDAQTLTALVGAWQGGALSEGELFEMLKRGDVIDSEKTLEDHQGEIDAAPPLAMQAIEAGMKADEEDDEEEAV